MAHTAVIGATGLVGSQILSQLLESSLTTRIQAITRRPFPPFNLPAEVVSKLNSIVEPDSSKWPASVVQTDVFFSALGTTRGDAGGIEKQRKIDYELNLEMAKAAKEKGVKTYVLVSSAGASVNSFAAYSKMKGELERDVIALKFEKTIILRPGLLVGNRGEKTRTLEQPLHSVANFMGKITPVLKDVWAQEDSTVARAAIRAAFEEATWEGRTLTRDGEDGKVWIMSQKEIVELGKK
ncbi:NAD(P)-binding protein [Atractiella rhizophila]|nr:NAD(P)-binding protein [Atractiella rhizophila]